MANIITSKEVVLGVITLVLSKLVAYAGMASPITPAEIMQVGLFVMIGIRVFLTQEKITGVLPHWIDFGISLLEDDPAPAPTVVKT